ncbi:MAG: tyrosine-type recombinase/integrase [Bacteroidales bacterium]|nr:tyrosine-type recombinase/integrase [Bacteroidales bacterium]
MKTVHIESTLHRGTRRIKINSPLDEVLINRVKAIEGRRWSRTMQCWHLPYTEYCIKELRKMKEELKLEIPEIGILEEEKRTRYFDRHLTAEKYEFIRLMEQYMEVQRYSEKTIATYLDAIRTFLGYFKDKNIEDITNADLSDFNYRYILKNAFSESYQNQVVSAIKLFYRNIINREISIEEIERPRKGRHLPDIFSVQEIELLLQNTRNLKHRAMLSLIYACGLRRSELINLKINAIDSKRMLLSIKGGKGNKDRVVPIPGSLIIMLREYYKAYRPAVWLFEGTVKGRQYSEASLWQVFEAVKKKSKITKKLTLHSLRHSYATHLLENGVDLRFIQELLGHKSSKTTEIYTHVTQKSIERIKSPFENLKLK